ncbi:magnesium/cobalt transporter CorA [Fibrivirga algicola]|uniref:Magnesium transport protein CorA n=1 Tax=Fibrivirga algicola TaxID=2950420 RepID=A0ABX0QK67_9BACT|nr:magnesium/cobalt transporter CorA [Fibrivirga algicola]ARK11935.1 magnesium and cobalt transport protein CorA [Fibrella sp. ES10-3-2-2]NID11248.1 magnesium/cobalt transporter CorA [Fibrivirga algicola]
MIRIFQQDETAVRKVRDFDSFQDTERTLWVDLQNPTPDEIKSVEEKFDVSFQSQQEQAEIESSSRYIEEDDRLVANSNFLIPTRNHEYKTVPVNFLLKDDVLFTYRFADLKSFADMVKKIKSKRTVFSDGAQIMIAIFESRIDYDADLVESLSTRVKEINKQLDLDAKLDREMLLLINDYQELTMSIRENVVDKQRVISAMIRSNGWFTSDEQARLRIVIKDINSLIDHTNFIFERLEFLQNTFLGLVNLEQNNIIKIFTVLSLVLLPPTLIASIYGMNFTDMPELSWRFGYLFALGLMAISSGLTYYFFKKKNWL